MSTSTDEAALIAATHTFVKSYMSHYDSSHDYTHIQRVHSLSQQILAASPAGTYNPLLVTLLALLHDVGDKKYLPAGSTSTTTTTTPSTVGPIEEFLLSAHCDPALASTVQNLINNLSYSHEQKHRELVAALVAEHPELAIVQDADRLDAIGAVGIGRAFVYGASKKAGDGMSGVMEHFDEKLVKLAGGMKTVEGKKLAAERGERIRLFMGWWAEEAGAP